MAILFGGITNDAENSNADNSFTSPSVSGSNTLAILGIRHGGGADKVTSATWNGVAMTRVNRTNDASNSVYIYYLLNPAAGQTTVAYHLNSGIARTQGFATYYTGVSQSGFPDASSTATHNSTNAVLTATLTTIANNAWMSGMGVTCCDGTPALSGSGIRRDTTGGAGLFIDRNADLTPAGNYSLAITTGTASDKSLCVVSFAPAGATVANQGSTLSMLGVGH